MREAIQRLARGPRVSRLLESLDIDPKRYWLLMDLFGQISERGEMLDQLGRNGVALKTATYFYFAMSTLLSVALVVAQTVLTSYLSTFMIVTATLLLIVLLSETGNSLVNPAEGMVLAHQPINGATYSAAKLTHLFRIVLYLVLGMNAVPAAAGLMLADSRWSYPVVHLLAAFAVGLVAALLCCGLFGWLIRFVPARRLKAAGQLAGTLPFLAMMWWGQIRDLLSGLNVSQWLPREAAARWFLGVTAGSLAVAMVVFGIRSLSADYLIRVSGMMRGGPAGGAGSRQSRIGELVARFFGGQAARAGSSFVSRMMLRDWQFRRQMIPLAIPALAGLAPLVVSGWRKDPFSGAFSLMHVLPHIFGAVLFFVCMLLPYGSDHKGAWIFLLAPARAIDRFARGVHALLWIEFLILPHLVILLLLMWPWGWWRAVLFTVYSAAVASVYLALELRLIEGAPFSRQPDASRSAVGLPLMILGGAAMAIGVGIQYFLVFRSPVIVTAMTIVLSGVAYLLTQRGCETFAVSIRYSLGLLSVESGTLYKEVDV